jgi:hypothetical protein
MSEEMNLHKVTSYLNQEDYKFLKGTHAAFNYDRIEKGLPELSLSKFVKGVLLEWLSDGAEVLK